ncbi:MAG: 50S ribosomal protein L10 [Candidatus Nealsonbacteria bacterium CG23_combo_of_CG06-09_8_20_14_all_36_12]|uniref:Large ribosomal subunit protein uL10 n=2 Tax=Candidatus Nealsoniibacteriota TaxID=1817911 RepID=A0A2H0TKT1_9BACT|nr:MAG: 50S ribosomal protein L10 [Candidatus Nealsonbacteria bacterium CG23_combo_of_CG06-09_8_20_14_all_36_12]PIR72764.1 MAG: 50S ribosomal protein L10 [Candidatus Nealsonbacteria bacterium CG10_big_fil_rev_8_21_14_0_10_36_23]
MSLTKAQKEKIVEDLTNDLKQQKSVVFVAIGGLKVKDLSGLRRKLKEIGGKLKVVKKTLMKIAFEKMGLKLPENLIGEIALVSAFENEILPIKSVHQFSKENENLKILSGIFEGKLLEKEKIIEIAELPTKEELLARLVRSVSAPISGLVNVLQSNLRGLVYILSTIKRNEQ